MSGIFGKSFEEKIETYFKNKGIKIEERVNNVITEEKKRINDYVTEQISENINKEIDKVLTKEYMTEEIRKSTTASITKKFEEKFDKDNIVILLTEENQKLEAYLEKPQTLGPIQSISNYPSADMQTIADVYHDIKEIQKIKGNLVYIKKLVETNYRLAYVADVYFCPELLNQQAEKPITLK